MNARPACRLYGHSCRVWIIACAPVLLVAGIARAELGNCRVIFTKIPVFVVHGSGTCQSGDIGNNKSDILEVDVVDRNTCKRCEVVATASWTHNGAAQTQRSFGKSPRSATDEEALAFWPHKI